MTSSKTNGYKMEKESKHEKITSISNEIRMINKHLTTVECIDNWLFGEITVNNGSDIHSKPRSIIFSNDNQLKQELYDFLINYYERKRQEQYNKLQSTLTL